MKSLLVFAILTVASSICFAYDPSPLQDICVAVKDPLDGVFVNGKFCQDPMKAKAEDFVFQGLHFPGDTNNPLGSNVTTVTVENLPGLNTLGVAVARVDFAPYGLNPPHIHPRSSEMLMVIQGELYAGFILSNKLNNTLITKILYPGDIIVFPIGTIHFQLNVAKTPAVAFASFNSQFPGITTVAKAIFGSKPPIEDDVLAKAFQLDKKVVDYLQKLLWYDNTN